MGLINRSSKTASKVESLEGLRGIAALIVVFTHTQQFFFPELNANLIAVFAILPSPLALIAEAFFMAFIDGGFAVWTFWVLSGFVLSYHYVELSQRNPQGACQYLIVAAAKRYFRLVVPVLVSVLIALLLIETGLMANETLAQYYLKIHPDWGGYANWLTAFYNFEPGLVNALKSALWDTFVHYDRAVTYNPVLWTMEKELFGSLFLFAFLGLLRSLGNSGWLWAAAVLLLTLARLHWVTAFLIGALICYYYRTQRTYVSTRFSACFKHVLRPLQNPVFLAVCLLVLWVFVGLPNYLGVSSLVIASFLVILSLASTPLSTLLSARPVMFLGRISFGLYLGHFLLVTSFSSRLYLFLAGYWPHHAAASLTALFTLTFSLLLGWLIYRLGDVGGTKLANVIGRLVFQTITTTRAQ